MDPLEEELNRDSFWVLILLRDHLSVKYLQFDMVLPMEHMKTKWTKLRKDISKYGVKVFLQHLCLTSTSQILGNNECFEPFTSNIYIRRTLAGEFIVMNKYLIRDLINIGVWNNDIKDQIIANNGSIQDIKEIPQTFKNIYKNVWELSNKTLIDMAADRGALDQSQSLNLFGEPDFSKLSSSILCWGKGLKMVFII